MVNRAAQDAAFARSHRRVAAEQLSTNVMLNPRSAFKIRILGVLCILVLCGILVVGLWPFHAPINDVTWLENSDGVEFGSHGTLVSDKAFEPESSVGKTFCSLEISLQPGSLNDSSTILAFYTPESGIQFSLEQFGADIALENRSQDPNRGAKGARSRVYVRDVFLRSEPLLIAIASGVAGTSVYVDGVLLGFAPQFRLSTGDCSGQLVLGTSPVVNRSWSGQLREFAIYKELTADQVSRHFERWTVKKRFDVGRDEHTAALYLFNEHQGRTVHDSSGSEINLAIPERFLIVHEKFLEPPWEEFHNDWGYWKNVLINIGGFVPLGFLFYACLAMAKRSGRPASTTVMLGAAVSLTIEVLQAYLPTRDSGMTDIITNTLGSAVGVILYRWKAGLVMDIFHRIAAQIPPSGP
jgi:hypothetical protein